MRALVLLLALAGCAATEGSLEEREQAGLARDLAERVEGDTQSCAPGMLGGSLVAVDRRTVTVNRTGTIWVNRLRGDCPSLRPTSTIIVEANGDRYCNGDRIRAIEPGSTIPGPICILGDWTEYRPR